MSTCRLAMVLLIALLLVALLSCSGNPPSIAAVSYQLALHPLDPSGKTQEKLSVFAAAKDEDGLVDLEGLSIINDAEGLFWSLDASSWVQRDEGADVWIGSNGLAMPDRGPLPRGLWRIILTDKVGERSEKSFVVASPETAGMELPQVWIRDGKLGVSSKYPSLTAIFYDPSGEAIRSIQVSPGSTDMAIAFGAANWKERLAGVVIYAYDPKSAIGAFSWKATPSP